MRIVVAYLLLVCCASLWGTSAANGNLTDITPARKLWDTFDDGYDLYEGAGRCGEGRRRLGAVFDVSIGSKSSVADCWQDCLSSYNDNGQYLFCASLHKATGECFCAGADLDGWFDEGCLSSVGDYDLAAREGWTGPDGTYGTDGMCVCDAGDDRCLGDGFEQGSCDIDWDIEFEEANRGGCPAGWTCTGSAQTFSCDEEGVSGASTPNCDGTGYLSVGGDGDMGRAISDSFYLPSTATTLKYIRCGGADSPSGVYVKAVDSDTVICQSVSGTDTDTFFEVTCDISSGQGLQVYVDVIDETSSSWGKVFVDNFRFLGSDGLDISVCGGDADDDANDGDSSAVTTCDAQAPCTEDTGNDHCMVADNPFRGYDCSDDDTVCTFNVIDLNWGNGGAYFPDGMDYSNSCQDLCEHVGSTCLAAWEGSDNACAGADYHQNDYGCSEPIQNFGATYHAFCSCAAEGDDDEDAQWSYEAVYNQGCNGYIHMDNYNTYGVQGGSTTLEECAAAVRELDGSNRCMGDYFFFEYGGYCNCPTDSCSLGYENSNAGGDGQLYKFTASSTTTCSDKTCDELDFTWLESGGVCAERDSASLGGQCSGDLSFTEAVAFCEDAGARLCTVDEIADLGMGTGCGYDADWCWTQTQCDDGFYTAQVYTDGGEICEATSIETCVTCCADEEASDCSGDDEEVTYLNLGDVTAVTGYSCEANGYTMITTEEECWEAGEVLGLTNTDSWYASDRPPGCHQTAATISDTIYFNTNLDSTDTDYSDSVVCKTSSSSGCDPYTWSDLDNGVVCGECKALVTNMDDSWDTCEAYCASEGLSCVDAWEEEDDDCTVSYQVGCQGSFADIGTSDALCECSDVHASTDGGGDALFLITDDSMNYDAGAAYCANIGASLAGIYNYAELTRARDVIAAAGIGKAITSAVCTSSGWSWGEVTNYAEWKEDEFPLNTGEVTDYAGCTDGNHVYSLHASGDSFVWDADKRSEEHPVLCRREGDADTGCRVRAYESVGCNCDPSSTCSDMSDSSAEECCGTGGGYCDVEWTTTGQWLNMDDYGCHGTDFFRVSPGCSLTVATGNDGTGATYDYDSSVLVCGYDQCESRDTPGCDTVRSIYITGSSGDDDGGDECDCSCYDNAYNQDSAFCQNGHDDSIWDEPYCYDGGGDQYWCSRNDEDDMAGPCCTTDDTLGDGHCRQNWCRSPDGHHGFDCWAGTESEGCTCNQGKVREIPSSDVHHDGQTYIEYTCCKDKWKDDPTDDCMHWGGDETGDVTLCSCHDFDIGPLRFRIAMMWTDFALDLIITFCVVVWHCMSVSTDSNTSNSCLFRETSPYGKAAKRFTVAVVMIEAVTILVSAALQNWPGVVVGLIGVISGAFVFCNTCANNNKCAFITFGICMIINLILRLIGLIILFNIGIMGSVPGWIKFCFVGEILVTVLVLGGSAGFVFAAGCESSQIAPTAPAIQMGSVAGSPAVVHGQAPSPAVVHGQAPSPVAVHGQAPSPVIVQGQAVAGYAGQPMAVVQAQAVHAQVQKL